MSDIIFKPDGDFLTRMDKVEDTLIQINMKLNKIFDVVVGDAKFDQEGIISRVKKLEAENEKNKALKNKLVGAFIVGGAVWTVVFEVIKKIFL